MPIGPFPCIGYIAPWRFKGFPSFAIHKGTNQGRHLWPCREWLLLHKLQISHYFFDFARFVASNGYSYRSDGGLNGRVSWRAVEKLYFWGKKSKAIIR